MNRAVLFVPKSELEAYFKSNARQDVKIVVSALMTEMLSVKLRARGKAVKDEVPFTETHWRHSSAEEPNRVCPSADFADDLISLPAAGPFAMSFAAPGAVETFHHHKEHWEIYFSEHRIGAEYRLPGLSRPEETILEDGGAIVFGPSISHRMKIHGLTVVLEVPAVAGDRETDS